MHFSECCHYVCSTLQLNKSLQCCTGWLLTRPPAQQDTILQTCESIFPGLFLQVLQSYEPKMQVWIYQLYQKRLNIFIVINSSRDSRNLTEDLRLHITECVWDLLLIEIAAIKMCAVYLLYSTKNVLVYSWNSLTRSRYDQRKYFELSEVRVKHQLWTKLFFQHWSRIFNV